MPTTIMQLPGHDTSTGDIFRSGSAPPAAPAVAAVSISICRTACYGNFPANCGIVFTHIIHLGATVDVRDGYSVTGTTISQVNPDSIWIPDQNGTEYFVRYVERVHRGTPNDHKRVFIQRRAPTWPTNDL